VSLSVNSRILLGFSTIAALAAGAGTAVLASGAHGRPQVIRLVGNVERQLTIKGSDRRDSITVQGSAPGSITIGADHTISSMRTDCSVSPSFTQANCEGHAQETIEIPMGGGGDELELANFDGDNQAVRMIARGAAGADVLDGSPVPDRFDGGAGDDVLRGHDGNDDLDGGADRDSCKGGPGHDHVRHCE
jgi:Ca2+-binding RTX toxin-like protein